MEECNSECLASSQCTHFALGKAAPEIGDCYLYKTGCSPTADPLYDYYLASSKQCSQNIWQLWAQNDIELGYSRNLCVKCEVNNSGIVFENKFTI